MTDTPTGDKVRLRFRKFGVLRLLSHLDLVRCVERMMRRANVPFRTTQGFRQGPRLVFALSLPLGVEGVREVVEIELTESLSADTIESWLNASSPNGLEFFAAKLVPIRATAAPRRAVYQLPLPAERSASAAERCQEVLDQDQVWVERYQPKPRRLNIRPYLRNLRVEDQTLTFDLWVTGQGTARADELARIFELSDWLEAGQYFRRTDLEIVDELNDEPAGGPPVGPPESMPITGSRTVRPPTEQPSAGQPQWGLSPQGPVVE